MSAQSDRLFCRTAQQHPCLCFATALLTSLSPLLRFPLRPDFSRSGAFAQVRKCVDKMTGRQYAMKIIDKKKFMSINSSGRLDSLMDEVNILRAADHPGIIKMYDVIETPKTLYVILELVTGGDLFDRIVAQDGKG